MSVLNPLRSFQKLPEHLKAILRLKALFYFDVPLQILRESFYSLPYLSPDALRAAVSATDFQGYLTKLRTLGFINSSATLFQNYHHLLTVEALTSEHAEDYLHAFESGHLHLKDHPHARYSRGEEDKILFRVAIYGQDVRKYEDISQKIPAEVQFSFLQTLFLKEPLENSWLKVRPQDVQQTILQCKLMEFYTLGGLEGQIEDLLEVYLPLRNKDPSKFLDVTFLLYDLFSGNQEKAIETLKKLEVTSYTRVLQGMAVFISRQTEEAIGIFEETLKSMRKASGKKNMSLDVRGTLFYVLALLKTGDRKLHSKIQTLLIRAKQDLSKGHRLFDSLGHLLLRLQGHPLTGQIAFYGQSSDDPLTWAIGTLINYWVDEKTVDKEQSKIFFKRYKVIFPLGAKIFAEVLLRVDSGPLQEYGDYLEQDVFKGTVSFVESVRVGESWERVLESLSYFFEGHLPGISKGAKRLVWHFNPLTKYVEVFEQTQGNGKWSKGRPV